MEELDLLMLIGTSFMFLLVVGLILLFLFYQNHLMKLRKQKAEMLLKVSLQTEKKERKRIAADLHDAVLGDLAAIRNILRSFRNQINEPEYKDKLLELEEITNSTLSSTREISHNLMPPLLKNHGLRLALFDYIEKLNKLSTTKYSISFPDSCSDSFYNENSYELYRIIQEFTTNSMKYGNCGYFNIDVSCNNGKTLISLEDDGESYDFFSLYKSSTGSGIKNILSRVEAINADLKQLPKKAGNHFVLKIDNKE